MKEESRKKWFKLCVVIAVVIICMSVVQTLINKSNTRITEETIEEEIPFEHLTKEDNTLRKGTEKIAQEGHKGLKSVIYEVSKLSGKETGRKVKESTVITEPVSEIKLIGTKIYYKCSNGIEYETESEKNECEKRISWESTKSANLQECYNDPNKFNCWYDEYPGTTLHWTEYTYAKPTYSSPSYRTGAVCKDGTSSGATGRGACSHHGGVLYWV